MAPTLNVTFSPDPATAADGIVITAIGPVRPQGQIVVSKSAVPHAYSPVFGQKNRSGKTSQVTCVAVTAAGGTFKLKAEKLYDLDPRRTGQRLDLGTTAPIAYNAVHADVQAACEAVWGVGNVLVTGGPAASSDLTLTFVGALADLDISVSAVITSLTGDGHAVVVDNTVEVGGVETPDFVAGGPYVWGPIYLPSGTYSIDVLATADTDVPDVEVGDSLLSAPVAMVIGA